MALAAQASKSAFDPFSLGNPRIAALVGFYHTCVGSPVKQTWLDAIKAGNFDTFEGLSYSNAAKYCPDLDKTILGHLVQQRQNTRSTKPKAPIAGVQPSNLVKTPTSSLLAPSNDVFIRVYPLSKLYIDDTGRFRVKARSGKQYIMIAFHAKGNLILQ